MTVEQPRSTEDRIDLNFGRDDSTVMSLSERIVNRDNDLLSGDNQSMRLNAGGKDPMDGTMLCFADTPFGKSADALGGVRDLTGEFQAGKGKTITLELGIENGNPTKYTIPLDDIGNKKGKLVTDGKTVTFKQSDGTIYNSTYELQWFKKDGQYKFQWK